MNGRTKLAKGLPWICGPLYIYIYIYIYIHTHTHTHTHIYLDWKHCNITKTLSLTPHCLSLFTPHLFTFQCLWIKTLKYLSNPSTSLHTHSHHSCPNEVTYYYNYCNLFCAFSVSPHFLQFFSQPGWFLHCKTRERKKTDTSLWLFLKLRLFGNSGGKVWWRENYWGRRKS